MKKSLAIITPVYNEEIVIIIKRNKLQILNTNWVTKFEQCDEI